MICFQPQFSHLLLDNFLIRLDWLVGLELTGLKRADDVKACRSALVVFPNVIMLANMAGLYNLYEMMLRLELPCVLIIASFITRRLYNFSLNTRIAWFPKLRTLGLQVKRDNTSTA